MHSTVEKQSQLTARSPQEQRNKALTLAHAQTIHYTEVTYMYVFMYLFIYVYISFYSHFADALNSRETIAAYGAQVPYVFVFIYVYICLYVYVCVCIFICLF